MMVQIDSHQLFLKSGHEIISINITDILFLEYNQRKSIIHTRKSSYEVNAPLSTLEKWLSDRFFRSHRSYIINLDWIEKIISWNAKSYSITFRDSDKEALLSRQRKNDILHKINLI
ncbi:MAG: hypothetical protein CVU88_04425 [Firmicutes bacterium HGW-Firmicutes-13]|nr:MAG: hypothetical protein CVU88_04425 [Firmicutes bacterium HGW-Firmicutes-13]